jgi:hypothetical protein
LSPIAVPAVPAVPVNQIVTPYWVTKIIEILHEFIKVLPALIEFIETVKYAILRLLRRI